MGSVTWAHDEAQKGVAREIDACDPHERHGIALRVELHESLVELERVDKGDSDRTFGCHLGLATKVVESADAMKRFAEDELTR